MTQKKRKSVACTLTSLLGITRCVLWYVIVTLPLTALSAPFFPITIGGDFADPDAVWPTVFLSPFLEQNGTRAALYLETLIGVIAAALGLFVIHHFLRILRNVQSGAAFARENGVRLRKIGFAIAGVQLSIYGLWFASLLADMFAGIDFEGLMVTLSPAPWIGVFGAFALSTIFLEGAEIKEEQDLIIVKLLL